MKIGIDKEIISLKEELKVLKAKMDEIQIAADACLPIYYEILSHKNSYFSALISKDK